jgi:hypothetical protein
MLTAKQVKNNGQADMYYIENTHEAIIEASDTQTQIRQQLRWCLKYRVQFTLQLDKITRLCKSCRIVCNSV